MTLAVLTNESLKQELLLKGIAPGVEIVWADSVRSLSVIEADMYIDLLFELDRERTDRLKQLLPKPVLVNAVPFSTKTIGADFIRLNAWPTLLQRSVLEIVLPASKTTGTVNGLFGSLQWNYQVVPDLVGMITPRIIAMIINEAYFTLGDEVSTREEIDIAMKLGTNYPFGPFEWSEKIGLKNVYELLKELSRNDKRYIPAAALEAEAN
jgi:3-hydroxybutyryl-CoA dehydrogenase